MNPGDARTPVYKGERKYVRPSEVAVMRLLAQGLGPKETAKELNRSIKTIEGHMRAAKHALGCHTTAQLATEYVRHYEGRPI